MCWKKYLNSEVFAGLLNLKGECKNVQSKIVCVSDKASELLSYCIFKKKIQLF